MRFLCYLNKPEYIFRPRQILRRLAHRERGVSSGFVEVGLPWGLPLNVRPREMIGAAILKLGIYDITVSESIWRLLEPGECALDVGANIGHMSSIMAARAGAEGTVHLFEPHPQVFRELQDNVRLWRGHAGVCPVQAHNFGLSDMNGAGLIEMPESFDGNRGTAYVVPSAAAGEETAQRGTRDVIQLRRLDEFWASEGGGRRIDLVKLDVEGHELSVLKGASGLLEQGLIRDIVFEENRPYPTGVTEYLSRMGYRVYLLEKGFLGPLVSLPARGQTPRIPWEPPAYLATREPERALDLLNRRGWRVLAGHPLHAR